jgi:hypothetical protein
VACERELTEALGRRRLDKREQAAGRRALPQCVHRALDRLGGHRHEAVGGGHLVRVRVRVRVRDRGRVGAELGLGSGLGQA